MGDVWVGHNLSGWGAAMRKRNYDDDENRPGWFWKFVRGVLIAVLVSAGAVAALSVYVLPPPPPPVVAEAPVGPVMINGIEVSTEPAYSNGAASGAAAPELGAPQPESAETGTPETGAPETGTLETVELSGPAFSVNAEPFDAPPDMPLVAVILADTASNPLLHEMLFSMKVPLTIGVVAGGGGDRETATAARAAGFELVAELPVAPPGASGGSALEYGMAEADAASHTLTLIQRLPMAVAAARAQDAVKQPDPSVLKGMVSALMPLGFAFVDHGMAPEDQSTFVAAGLEMPIGVSRFNVPAGVSAVEVIAMLDLAAADAARRGGAVVFAPPDEQVILALRLWGEVGAGNLAQLAPLSAVIRRQNGG
jgi:polysaccharide deacetylase 2 family uncharacterized protein YibQ